MSLGMWTLVRMHQQWQFPIPGNGRVSLHVQNEPLTLHFFKVPLQRATAHLHRHKKTIVSDIPCYDTLLDQSWIYYSCTDPSAFILQEESRKLLTFSSEQRDLRLASHPVNHMHSQCHGQAFLSPAQSQILSNVHMGGWHVIYTRTSPNGQQSPGSEENVRIGYFFKTFSIIGRFSFSNNRWWWRSNQWVIFQLLFGLPASATDLNSQHTDI